MLRFLMGLLIGLVLGWAVKTSLSRRNTERAGAFDEFPLERDLAEPGPEPLERKREPTVRTLRVPRPAAKTATHPEAYCPRCKALRAITNLQESRTKTGRIAYRGHCAVCDTPVYRLSGQAG